MGKVLIVADSGHWLGFANGLKRLDKTGSEFFVCRSAEYCRSRGHGVIELHNVDVGDPEVSLALSIRYSLVVSLHCQQIFHSNLTKNTLCVNLHPGILPHGRGRNPYAFALNDGTAAGATLHVMDEQIDHGPIIAVQEVLKRPEDTCDTLYVRVVKAEEVLITEYLPKLIQVGGTGALAPFPEPQPRARTKKDCEELCKLDLDSMDARQLLKCLAALTFGDQLHANFIDASGRRLHVGVVFERKV